MRQLLATCGVVVSALSLLAANIRAGDIHFESRPNKTRLLELYTSEGCSSCPPAEAWLSRLQDSPRLWQDFAPLAFHVDYWDRLGWRDPYAAKAWTERQYRYSAAWRSGSVYTPGFVLDGREWHNDGAPAAARELPGILRVAMANGVAVTAQFEPANDAARPLELHVARLGFGLFTQVKAGENRGRKLQHDFVVLALASAKMDAGRASLSLAQSDAPLPPNGRTALVAWITTAGELEPLQATGGWIQ